MPSRDQLEQTAINATAAGRFAEAANAMQDIAYDGYEPPFGRVNAGVSAKGSPNRHRELGREHIGGRWLGSLAMATGKHNWLKQSIRATLSQPWMAPVSRSLVNRVWKPGTSGYIRIKAVVEGQGQRHLYTADVRWTIDELVQGLV